MSNHSNWISQLVHVIYGLKKEWRFAQNRFLLVYYTVYNIHIMYGHLISCGSHWSLHIGSLSSFLQTIRLAWKISVLISFIFCVNFGVSRAYWGFSDWLTIYRLMLSNTWIYRLWWRLISTKIKQIFWTLTNKHSNEHRSPCFFSPVFSSSMYGHSL